MRDRPDAETDSAAGLTNVPWIVTEVRALPEYRLFVRFIDGTEGEVDASRLILGSSPGVFSVLRDPARFAQVRVEYGAVTWPGELDLAPDSMHAVLKAEGRYLLEPFPSSESR